MVGGAWGGAAWEKSSRAAAISALSVEEPSSHTSGLLAEDGPENQLLISLFLKRAGAQVVLAENGRVAIDKALHAWRNGQPFDVILMDMQMPELDGYGAASKLREEGYRGAIVALTAHAMPEDRTRCLEAGCDDYTAKPIDRSKLLTLVREHSST